MIPRNFESAYRLALELPSMSDSQIAAILAAIEADKYSGEVVAGFARGVLDMCVKVDFGDVFDTCGTGGDAASTLNVSTAVAISLSTLHPVAKHGNRAISSKSGSADVLDSLGIRSELTPENAKKLLEETDFTFLLAPLYHPCFARVSQVRRKLGMRTIFNIVGPLANPAEPKRQLLGVSSEDLLQPVAEAMEILGRSGLVVFGGIDEVSVSGETMVAVVENGIDVLRLTPADFGIPETRIVPCRSSSESARRIRAVFSGSGLVEDIRLIAANFAAALFALGYDDLSDNVELFYDKVESGEFAAKLEEIVCKSTNL